MMINDRYQNPAPRRAVKSRVRVVMLYVLAAVVAGLVTAVVLAVTGALAAEVGVA